VLYIVLTKIFVVTRPLLTKYLADGVGKIIVKKLEGGASWIYGSPKRTQQLSLEERKKGKKKDTRTRNVAERSGTPRMDGFHRRSRCTCGASRSDPGEQN
jgi:hypothetical protein